MKQTFSERLKRAKNILAGVAVHSETLAARGITAEAIAKATELYEQNVQLDDARNALKARSQEATAQFQSGMDELERFCSQVRTMVRMDLPKETWPEFGFREGQYAAKPEPAESES